MKRGIFLVLLVAGLWLCPVKATLAAMATIQLTTPSETVRVDEEFEVSIIITSQPSEGESAKAAIIGDFEAFLLYDDSLFEFVTAASSCITGGGGNLRIADFGAEPSRESRKYVIRFRAIEMGDANFSFYTTPNVYVYGGGIDDRMPALTDILEISVQASETASDNANLSALKISPGSLTPTFATTLREYYVTVPYSTDMVIVSALTEDENASVSVHGTTGLLVGENKVVVTVTAENGTEKRYYIFVTREKEAPEPTKEPEQEKLPEDVALTEGIHASVSGEYTRLSFGKKYLVSKEASDYVAPTGYEETILYVDGCRIKAYVKRGEPQNDFFILVLIDENGKSGYYRYDRLEQTIQRFEETAIEIKQVVEGDTGDLQAAIRKYKGNQVLLIFFLALFFSLSMTFLLVILKMYQKYKSGDDGPDA